MKHAVTIIAAATALLASCDQPAPTPKPVIKVQGDEQRQLAAASDMNRAIALKRAIYDGGATCKRVTATGFVTDYKNLAMWQAHCDDGKDWAIFIAANGSIQVRPCADLKELKLPECKVLDVKKAAGTKPAA
ncbi:hypothetical protein [Sphingomonas sp.]|uniref:hypothetical protein n=1 Tax=Sphingomonas sp. TaxID=28214 RepID=UPI00286A84B5|nr:hypothetical protein [Sphingomonas sp.]